MRALIVLLEERVSEAGAEEVLADLEADDYPIVHVEHFTERRALALIEEGRGEGEGS